MGPQEIIARRIAQELKVWDAGQSGDRHCDFGRELSA
jgi:hypothetical protein